MASIANVAHEELNHTAVTSQATTMTPTVVVGTVLHIGASASNGADLTVTSTGATWTQRGSTQAVGTGFMAVWQCTAGSSTSAITVGSSDSFADLATTTYDPTDVAVAATNVGTNGAAGVTDLTVTITVDNPALLVAHGFVLGSSVTFATDGGGGWTQEFQAVGGVSTNAQQILYRTTDDADVLIDPTGTQSIGGIVVSFDASASTSTGKLAGAPGKLAGIGGSLVGLGGGLVGFSRVGRLFRRPRLIVPVGIDLAPQGA